MSFSIFEKQKNVKEGCIFLEFHIITNVVPPNLQMPFFSKILKLNRAEELSCLIIPRSLISLHKCNVFSCKEEVNIDLMRK